MGRPARSPHQRLRLPLHGSDLEQLERLANALQREYRGLREASGAVRTTRRGLAGRGRVRPGSETTTSAPAGKVPREPSRRSPKRATAPPCAIAEEFDPIARAS